MKLRCCDCGEDFDTQSLLEQHISIEHLSWSPYWCLYCKQNGVTLKKATKDALKVHVEKIHVGEQFLFIYEPDDAKEEEHRSKLNQSLALESQDYTAYHSLLSPAPTPVSPSTTSALEPKLEPLEQSEFQLPAHSSDSGWQFSSSRHCLTCCAQILNDGHQHKCQSDLPSTEPDIKQEVSYQLAEHFPQEHNMTNEPTATLMSKAKKKKKKFQCTVCGKEYGTSLSLRSHEDGKMHWGFLKHLTRLKCDLCPTKYHFAKALRLHRKRLHNADPQPTKSNKREMKKSHSKSVSLHEPPSMSKRKLCSQKIPNNRASNRKQVQSSGKPMFKCSMCPKEYETLHSLRSHEDVKMHWGTLKHLTEYHCETCNCTFHHRHMLYMHKEKIDDDIEKKEQPVHSTLLKASKVQCQLCNRVFRHEAGLSKHVCPVKPSYRCKLCKQEFDNFEMLDLHREIENHHETEKPIVPVVCPSCKNSFRNKRSLAVHKTNIHNGKKANLKLGSSIDCAGCGKVCKNLQFFSLHRRYKCPNLKQGIAQARSAVYSCSMCPRKFNSIVTMRFHHRAHRNEPDSPTQVMSTCVPCSKSLAPREIDSHLLKVHIKKVNNQVTLIQGDGYGLDERNIFDGDLMSKIREKLIVQDRMEKPKLTLKCKHCGKLFTTKEKLKKHQEMLVKSKLLSANIDFIQGEKHLMAKLCVKKCMKVIRKSSNVKTRV